MKRFTILITAMACLFITMTNAQPNAKINNDPAYRTGKLSNGLTYYIYRNPVKKARADFYLIQKAGSLLEQDNQNGLAHFLEHMAFNSTMHFPDKGILAFLYRHGVSLQSINAYTDKAETVYNLNDIPVTNAKLVDSCLLIVNDWACGISLRDDEIENERKIITEEFRTRDNANFRLALKTYPVLYNNSQYALRNVIGNLDVIANFKPETIREFYANWYRPDMQAVAVVGDVDVDEIERHVKVLFEQIPVGTNPKPMPTFDIPTHKDIFYILATDKERRQPTLSMCVVRKDPPRTGTVADLKRDYTKELSNAMMSMRLGEIIRADNKLVKGSIGVNQLVTGYGMLNVSCEFYANDDKQAESFSSLYSELQRVMLHGFTPTEIDRVKQIMLGQLDDMAAGAKNIPNEYYLNNIKSNFLHGEPMPNVSDYLVISKRIINELTQEDFNSFLSYYKGREDMTFVLTGPETGVTFMTKDEAISVIDKVDNSLLQPYEHKVFSAELIKGELAGSAVVKAEKLPVSNADMWTLANGAKVVFHQTNTGSNTVVLNAVSKGGTAIYDDVMLPSAIVTSTLVSGFGVGEFSQVQLGEILLGKRVTTKVQIDEFTESVSGSSSTDDFETLLKLTYLRFAQPRFDRESFNNTITSIRGQLPSISHNSQYVMLDSLNAIKSGYSKRKLLMNYRTINAVRFEHIETIYRDRIKDASDFTFYIVGDIDRQIAQSLVQKYIGSIESINRRESYTDHKERNPQGKTEKRIGLNMITPKSTVYVITSKEMSYTPDNSILTTMLEGVLMQRFQEKIRQEEGGTYGVGVTATLSEVPYNRAELTVTFDCEPNNAEHLKSLVYREIEDLKQNGITTQEFQNIILKSKKERLQVVQTVDFQMAALMYYIDHGVDISSDDNFLNLLDKMTKESFNEFIKQLFSDTSVIDLIFYPLD